MQTREAIVGLIWEKVAEQQDYISAWDSAYLPEEEIDEASRLLERDGDFDAWPVLPDGSSYGAEETQWDPYAGAPLDLTFTVKVHPARR